MEFREISGISSAFGTTNEISNESTSSNLFADVFKSAIDNVKETDADKNELQYLLSIGELDNPAELTIAQTKAATSVELLVELRSRALEAYNEIMRISL